MMYPLSRHSYRFIWLMLLLSLLIALPAQAQVHRDALSAIWRPGEQLTTLSADDDYRYVDLQLMLSADAQFWATDITCRFTPNLLLPYTHDSDGTATPDDPGDDVPVLTWGPDWGSEGDFVAVSTSGEGYDYTPANGTFTLIASRLGNVAAIGQNGLPYDMLVATIRLQVYEPALQRDAIATVSCRSALFLDRDGNSSINARFTPPAPLQIRTGYSLSGKVLQQGTRSHAGIQVTCNNLETSDSYGPVLTNARGDFFMFGGRNSTIRAYGRHRCDFESLNGNGIFLAAQVTFDLQTPSLTLLPVTLPGGNLAKTAGSEDDIDDADIAVYTSNWQPGSVITPYSGGDINGDRRVDRSDLAILTSNYAPDRAGPLDGSHMLFGLATSHVAPFPQSQVYLGDHEAGPIQPMFRTRRTRDFWPALSPDGTQIAVTRMDFRDNMSLTLLDTKSGRATTITDRRFQTPSFAPAWSPDGSRIAFICSWQDDGGTGYEYNQGNLCVINSTGRNNTVQTLAMNARIFPPAWFDKNIIIYAGTSGNVLCPDTLCYYDVNRAQSFKLSNSLDYTASDTVDMPAVARYDHDSNPATAMQPVLFYRFRNDSTRSLRAAALSFDGTDFSLDGYPTTGSHVAVGSSSKVDYYDVSPDMNVVYYESQVVGNQFQTLDAFWNLDFQGTLTAGWGTADAHYVAGFAGNLTTTSGIGGGQPWNGSEFTPTEFHIYRATMQWVP